MQIQAEAPKRSIVACHAPDPGCSANDGAPRLLTGAVIVSYLGG
jgi:hypothetical protein